MQHIKHLNEVKDESHLIISIKAEKSFDKTQYLFMIKVLKKLVIEGSVFNIIKAICDKLTADIVLKGEKLKHFL
jgi:CxxC motif-containing protein